MNKVGIFRVAVSVLIEKEGKKILITRRSSMREHAPNEWEVGITGRVDQGETFEETAHREVKEEIGIKISIIMPFDTFHFYRGKGKEEHLGVCYLAKYISGKITLDTIEQSEFKWVSPKESLMYIKDSNSIKEVNNFIKLRQKIGDY
jgi:NADH pyrophosphatase NudC (nudix superfamily)